MKLKKILVAALAVTMIMGSSSMAFAAEQKGEGTGAGDLDVVKDSDVFSVVVPTDSGTTFDYIVDPLGVIKKTDAEKYGNKAFEDGKTVYFQNAEVTSASAQYNYTGTSNKLKAINKSTKAVDIAVEATLTGADEVTMVEASGVTGTTDTLLNLQLNGSTGTNNTAAIGTSATAAKIDSTIDETANAYEIKYVNGKYVKQLDPALGDDDFKAYEFWLTGEANASSDWADVETLPEVKVVWTVTGEGAATGPSGTLSNTGLMTLSNLTADANAPGDPSKYKIAGADGEFWPMATTDKDVTWITDEWSSEDGGTLKIQLKGGYMANYSGQEVTVKIELTNGESLTFSGTLD